jgi:hypothetical protein
VKWLLAIPYFVVLFFLSIAAFFAVVIAWFAILIAGRYPRGLFDYVVGVGGGSGSRRTPSFWSPTDTRRSPSTELSGRPGVRSRALVARPDVGCADPGRFEGTIWCEELRAVHSASSAVTFRRGVLPSGRQGRLA